MQFLPNDNRFVYKTNSATYRIRATALCILAMGGIRNPLSLFSQLRKRQVGYVLIGEIPPGTSAAPGYLSPDSMFALKLSGPVSQKKHKFPTVELLLYPSPWFPVHEGAVPDPMQESRPSFIRCAFFILRIPPSPKSNARFEIFPLTWRYPRVFDWGLIASLIRIFFYQLTRDGKSTCRGKWIPP